jgi:hypothetical protein
VTTLPVDFTVQHEVVSTGGGWQRIPLGAPPEAIEKAAPWFSKGSARPHSIHGGIEHQSYGVETCTAIINLCLATGNIGREGAGCTMVTGKGHSQGGREHGQKCDQLPGTGRSMIRKLAAMSRRSGASRLKLHHLKHVLHPRPHLRLRPVLLPRHFIPSPGWQVLSFAFMISTSVLSYDCRFRDVSGSPSTHYE